MTGEYTMEKIQFDSGMKRYRINGGGVLQFNPADPNLYARFMGMTRKLDEIQKRLEQEETGDGLQLLQQADKEMKQLLGWVFGAHNDFDSLLGGVSLLAVASNGQWVITNLLAALEPVLEAGAESCARIQVQQAVEKANKRREGQRRSVPDHRRSFS